MFNFNRMLVEAFLLLFIFLLFNFGLKLDAQEVQRHSIDRNLGAKIWCDKANFLFFICNYAASCHLKLTRPKLTSTHETKSN